MDKERFAPGFKLMSHKHFTKYFEGKTIYPINVEISPSGVCNAKCENCFYRQNDNELPGFDKYYFKEDRMFELLREFKKLKIKSISWTGGGEPTLHPSFHKFVEWANKNKIEQGLFTNALKPIDYDPTLFEWIRVTKTNYSFNEEVLRSLRKCKTLGLCLNYSKNDNEEIIKEAIRIAEILEESKQYSEDSTYVQVRPALIIKGKTYENEVPKISHPLLQITDYKFLGITSERTYTKCEAFHFAPFIWQDGDVDVCGYHRKNPYFRLGNLYDEGESGKFKFIMKYAQKAVDVIDTCQVCCKLNEMNTVMNIRKNVIKDINFP
jgi:sulfatase maturation enzyme AslB (radical SAM superfamily)